MDSTKHLFFKNRELREGKRYLVKYYPLNYVVSSTRTGQWVRTKHPKYEEFIVRERRLSAWTGSYRGWSTHSIDLKDVLWVSREVD